MYILLCNVKYNLDSSYRVPGVGSVSKRTVAGTETFRTFWNQIRSETFG